MKQAVIALGALLCGLGLAATPSVAETYPSRSVQVIVPYPPSGALDTLARVVAQGLSDELKQPFVVVNKPGGATIAGSVFVTHSAPDGYTLLFGAAPIALNTALGMSQPFDPVKDLAPVSLVATNPAVIAVAPSSPYKTLKDILDAAKTKDVFYGTAGVGSGPHLVAEALKQEAKVRLVHSPFRGSAAALTAAMGGEVPVMVDLYIPAGAAVKQGQLRGVVVASKQRLPLLPDVPTTAEAGYPDIVGEGFFGILAPGKTSPDIIKSLQASIAKVCAKPDIRKRLEGLGYNVVASTPEGYATYLQDQVKRWTPVVKAGNIKVQ